MKTFVLIAAVMLATGCSSVTPIAKYTHVSHATQHIGKNKSSYGWDLVGVGVQVNIKDRVMIEVTENYPMPNMNGMHEVFVGSVTVKLW